MNKKVWGDLPYPQKYKKWLNETPYSWCKICSWNAKVGRIKYNDKFPSWHMEPPGHSNCDCRLAYITSTKKLDLSIGKDIVIWDVTEEWKNILRESRLEISLLLDWIRYLLDSRWWGKR